MSSKVCGVRTTIPEVQRACCASRRHCEGRLWSPRSIHWTGPPLHHKWRPQKVMDVIARKPDCDGQAADAISEKHRGKNGGRSKIVQNSKVRMSRLVDTPSKTQLAKIVGNMDNIAVPLERNLYGHPLAGLLWARKFEEALIELGWKKVPNWECYFVHRKQKLFLSVHVDDILMAGTKQQKAPMWKNWWKNVYFEEPTSFLNHVY